MADKYAGKCVWGDIKTDQHGKVLVAGAFTEMNGAAMPYLARRWASDHPPVLKVPWRTNKLRGLCICTVNGFARMSKRGLCVAFCIASSGGTFSPRIAIAVQRNASHLHI